MSIAQTTVTGETLPGGAIIAAIKAAGIRTIMAVPDIVSSEGLLFPISRDPVLRLIRVCKEDEAVGISAGLTACGQRSMLLIQHTGLLDSINALRAVAVEYSMPVCLMVGLLEKEPGVVPTKSGRYGVRIVEPILDAMGIAHHLLETAADVPIIPKAIDLAYEQSKPVVIMLGRRPVAP
jgi:sulfopyruvate decarboxylase subunit alpha